VELERKIDRAAACVRRHASQELKEPFFMATNLYVGNLSYRVSDSDLNELFAPFGTVISARVILDRDTQRSRGFGFVEMEDAAAAKQAVEDLNEKEFMGRRLKVNEARPRQSGGGFDRRGGDRY